MSGMADGAVYHFRVGKPDGFAIMGSPGWRIGQGKSNILIAEGSAYSMPIGLHLLQALTNEALTMTDSEAVKTMSARTGGRQGRNHRRSITRGSPQAARRAT